MLILICMVNVRFTKNEHTDLIFMSNGDQISDIGLLSALSFICINYDLPNMDVLWNQVYPNDPMTPEEAVTIMFEGVEEITNYNLATEDDFSLILEGLVTAGCQDLVQLVRDLLPQ